MKSIPGWLWAWCFSVSVVVMMFVGVWWAMAFGVVAIYVTSAVLTFGGK